MLKNIPQTEVLNIDNLNLHTTIDSINDYIDKNSCEKMYIDISFMNVIDACYVTTLCSAKHFIKYPNGKINWKVSSNTVKEFNKNLELGNNNYILE